LLRQTRQSRRQQSELAYAKVALGWSLLGHGNTPEAHGLFQEAVADAEAAEDTWNRAYALCMLGVTSHMQGRPGDAWRLMQQGIGLADEIGDSKGRAMGLTQLSEYACEQGEYQRAEALASEGLQILRDLGDRVGTTYALLGLGDIATASGDYALATRCFRDSLAAANETDSVRYFEVRSLNGLGAVALAQGQYAEANRLFATSARICEEVDVPNVTVAAQTGLGEVACILGEYDRSQDCFVGALKRAAETGSLRMMPEVLAGTAALWIREGEEERATELLGLIQYHPASTCAVKERVTHLMGEVASELSVEVVEAARARGAAQELVDVVASILQNNT
jgi:tetratricopeptide (TPR) repeat protein